MTPAQYLNTQDARDTLTTALAMFPNQRHFQCKSSSGFVGDFVIKPTEMAWLTVSLYDENPRIVARCYFLGLCGTYRLCEILGESGLAPVPDASRETFPKEPPPAPTRAKIVEIETLAEVPGAICKMLAMVAGKMARTDVAPQQKEPRIHGK